MSLFLSPDDSITDSIRKIQSIFSDILALCDLARSSSVDWSFSVSYHQYLRSFDSLFIMCKWRNLKITLGHLLIVKVIVYSFNEMRRKKLWYTWLFLIFLCSFVYFILSLFKFISNCFYSSLEDHEDNVLGRYLWNDWRRKILNTILMVSIYYQLCINQENKERQCENWFFWNEYVWSDDQKMTSPIIGRQSIHTSQ